MIKKIKNNVWNNIISQVERSSNVSTITTSEDHGFSVNDVVTVDCSDNTFDVEEVEISAVGSSTTFSYSNTGDDVTQKSETGYVGINKTWLGKVLEPEEVYTIPEVYELFWIYNTELISDVENGVAVVSDGTTEFDAEEGVIYLQSRGYTFIFDADQFDNPNNSDWAVNALAPLSSDSNNSALKVRLCDDTTEEGVGFQLKVPTGTSTMAIRLIGRAETAPGVTGKKVDHALYFREIPDSQAVGSWETELLPSFEIPNSVNFIYAIKTETMSTMGSSGLIPGKFYQFEWTRDATNPLDTLVGDFALLRLELEFI